MFQSWLKTHFVPQTAHMAANPRGETAVTWTQKVAPAQKPTQLSLHEDPASAIALTQGAAFPQRTLAEPGE